MAVYFFSNRDIENGKKRFLRVNNGSKNMFFGHIDLLVWKWTSGRITGVFPM
jgi:hypothetical protein